MPAVLAAWDESPFSGMVWAAQARSMTATSRIWTPHFSSWHAVP